MMYPYGGGGGAFGWGAALAMSIFGLLVLVGIILLIVWAVRAGEHPRRPPYYGPQGPPEHPGQRYQPSQPGMMQPQGPGVYQQPMRDPAVDAARERYARGEISREEYDEIMRNLGYPPAAQPPAPPPAAQ